MTPTSLTESVDFIRRQTALSPAIAVILGSGLGDFADTLPRQTKIATRNIPHYPVSTVDGHKGRLVFAELGGKPMLAFQGRLHFFESNSLEPVLYPIHVASALGIKTLIITNAAGAINRSYHPGDLMIIADQINLTLQRLPGFTGTGRPTSAVYSERLIEEAERIAGSQGIRVVKGVYCGLKGPSYETAAEIEMLSRLNADAVGMSTVFEASVAASLGMEVLGISCITNLATGIGAEKLSHAEVTEVGNRVKRTFASLLSAIVREI